MFQAGDLPGLFDLLGGNDKFSAKLDEFFNTPYNPKLALRDITGVMGLYIHGNEQYRNIPPTRPECVAWMIMVCWKDGML